MKVRDISTPEPRCINPASTLMDAARTMKTLDVGMLPVCENDRLIGTITDRDIIVRAVAEGRNVAITTVREVMTPEIAYCFDDQNLSEAADVMERRQVRRLPVLNREKHLVGIVSIGDLAVRSHKEKMAGHVLERVCEPAE
jgi:CBS domain-containing protein